RGAAATGGDERNHLHVDFSVPADGTYLGLSLFAHLPATAACLQLPEFRRADDRTADGKTRTGLHGSHLLQPGDTYDHRLWRHFSADDEGALRGDCRGRYRAILPGYPGRSAGRDADEQIDKSADG